MLFIIGIIASLTAGWLTASAQTQETYTTINESHIGVDVRDLTTFHRKSLFEKAREEQQTAKNNKKSWTPSSIEMLESGLMDLLSTDVLEAEILVRDLLLNTKEYSSEGAKYFGIGTGHNKLLRKNVIWGVEFTSLAKDISAGVKEVGISMLLQKPDTHDFIVRKFTIQMDVNTKTVVQRKLEQEIAAKDIEWNIRVGLLDRKMIVESSDKTIKKVYPLGVGAFDEGVTRGSQFKTRLMTPEISEAEIIRKYSVEAMNHKAYYENKPYMPIVVGGRISTFAFHGKIDKVNLTRGFVSHGCMRMRDKDLYELMTLLKTTQSEKISVTLENKMIDKNEHPYKLQNSYFYSVKNFGTKKNPIIQKDEDNLTITEKVVVSANRPLPVLSIGKSVWGNLTDLLDILRGHASAAEKKERLMQQIFEEGNDNRN